MYGFNPMRHQRKILLKHSSPDLERRLLSFEYFCISHFPYTPESTSCYLNKVWPLKRSFSSLKHNNYTVIVDPCDIQKMPDLLCKSTVKKQVFPRLTFMTRTSFTIDTRVKMSMPSVHHIPSIQSIHKKQPDKNLLLMKDLTFP
jgi:hypothetical protein